LVVLAVWSSSSLLVVVATAGTFAADEKFDSIEDDEKTKTPEILFRETVEKWRSSTNPLRTWNVWREFGEELAKKFESDGDINETRRRLDVVGAYEEGILAIERIVVENQLGDEDDVDRDKARE